MNGQHAAEALVSQFRAIRTSELTRLERKFRNLTEDDRKSVAAIAAEVIEAIAQVAHRALDAGASPEAVDMFVRLFNPKSLASKRAGRGTR